MKFLSKEVRTLRQVMEFIKDNPEFESYLDSPLEVQVIIDDEGVWDNHPQVRLSSHKSVVLECEISHEKFTQEEKDSVRDSIEGIQDLCDTQELVDKYQRILDKL